MTWGQHPCWPFRLRRLVPFPQLGEAALRRAPRRSRMTPCDAGLSVRFRAAPASLLIVRRTLMDLAGGRGAPARMAGPESGTRLLTGAVVRACWLMPRSARETRGIGLAKGSRRFPLRSRRQRFNGLPGRRTDGQDIVPQDAEGRRGSESADQRQSPAHAMKIAADKGAVTLCVIVLSRQIPRLPTRQIHDPQTPALQFAILNSAFYIPRIAARDLRKHWRR